MPYIKPVSRTEETENKPSDRGQLNWAITTKCLREFKKTKQGYDAHCELKAMLAEILQGIVSETDLSTHKYEEFTGETRLLMQVIDELAWGYMARTGDVAGTKQVLRDVVHEWNRRLTDRYERMKMIENGDVY